MCNCKKTKQVQTQVITGTPERISVEEIEKNHTIQPITPTEEQITEYLKHKDGRTNGETE